MFESLKEYLVKIKPYDDVYKCLVAYFLSLIGGKGIGLLRGITDPTMNYIVLAIGLTALILSNSSLKGTNTLFYWLGFIMIIMNGFSFKIMGVGLLIGIIALTVTAGVLKNLKLAKDIGGIQ